MTTLRSYFGPNAGYVLELYDRFLQDPQSVDPATRALFEGWTPQEEPAAAVEVRAPAPAADAAQAIGAFALAEAIRREGHEAAHLDPLSAAAPAQTKLSPADYGLSDEALAHLPATVVGVDGLAGVGNAREALAALRRIYCGTIAYEVDHIRDAAARAWLRSAIESGRYRTPLDAQAKRELLARLVQVEAFERFLHQAFPGKTRFSIEGTDMLVPMLDAILHTAAGAGVGTVVLGMAHRGRLNVLAHLLGQPYEDLIATFKDARAAGDMSWVADANIEGWTGDVRYHLGAATTYHGRNGTEVTLKLTPNPSHLEHVNPVAQGMVRAAQDDRRGPGAPVQHEDAALAVMVHGDAAFPGQGVVAETLNLARLPGYAVGGTIHILVNNQIGFTTDPGEGRSTRYASDLVRAFEFPIIHVNADDPEACLAAVRLACAYRAQFHDDVIIDLVGYRRWGHNEGDEPGFTQPQMYERIAAHPPVRELWTRELVEQGSITREEAEVLVRQAVERMQEARRTTAPSANAAASRHTEHAPPATAVPADVLVARNRALHQLPEGFTLHPRLERIWQRRGAALRPDGAVDWAHAEALAFASILADSTPIRLAGQDAARGTFSQRHLVLHDARTGAIVSPLHRLPDAKASFDIVNSPLSESAVVGFEYGYSVGAPDALVLWEAQYGDFVNGAQVFIDAFIASGWAKWRQRSGLVLLLPHGYEGQGPEHSSARLERFLQLAAKSNLRVAYCSTAAQYFHLLRRQAALLATDPRPLVSLTPKSLLRLPEAASKLEDLAHGAFQPVLDDARARSQPDAVRRLLLCSGKVYYDLLAADKERTAPVAVVRVEELYPFPEAEVASVLRGYPDLQEVVWVQEEPENMGAWRFVERRIRALTPDRMPVRYVGRVPWPSPAEGSAQRHAWEQARIVAEALGGVGQAARR